MYHFTKKLTYYHALGKKRVEDIWFPEIRIDTHHDTKGTFFLTFIYLVIFSHHKT